jgi:protein O-mannosyl-transferase
MPARLPFPLHRFAMTGVLLVTAAVYVQSIAYDFVYDDLGQIVYNPKIKSWNLALTYFTSHVWSQDSSLALYYRPFYMLWLRVNYALFGLHASYWHLAAIGAHLLVCLLLYGFAWRLTRDRWVAVVSTLLFGLHPAHVESVGWVSGSTESLLASLVLGSLLCYWKHRDPANRSPRPWLLASLALAFCAALVKETAIITPTLILGYEWIFSLRKAGWKRRLWIAVRAALPYVVVSVAFLLMRTLALRSVMPPATKVGRMQILFAWPEAIEFYTRQALIPYHMTAFYRLLTVPHPGLQNFILPALLTLGGAGVLYYAGQRSRLLAFLGAWWVITLLPLLSVMFSNNIENLHDRYLYLPSVAICMALALALRKLLEMHFVKSALAGLLVLAGVYTFLTVRELRYWRNDLALAEHGMEVSPGHPIAPQLMGNVFIQEGAPSEAIPYFVDALNAMPSNVETLRSLAYCYSETGALPLAEDLAGKALAIRESDSQAHLVMGMIRLKQDRLEEAEVECRRSIALQRVPTGVRLCHYYLGNVLSAKGDKQGALREYRAELKNDARIDPAFSKARDRIAEIEQELGAGPTIKALP